MTTPHHPRPTRTVPGSAEPVPPTQPLRLPDDPGEGRRWSTWPDLEPLQRGPLPRPAWVVVEAAALDTELGVLKTGKEADVHLVERAVPGDPDRAVVMAAKRYRDSDHRAFQRASVYTEGRRTRNSRDSRAVARGTAYGRLVAQGRWAAAEWEALCRCWRLGLPVPYPVQVDGTELLLEFVADPEGRSPLEAAPRLARTRPSPARLAGWWEQLRDALGVLAGEGLVHGDLSPYNLLGAGDRLVVIDLPQVVDLRANPRGPELLLRDCTAVTRWFTGRGLEVDEQELFADLLARAW